MMKFEDEEVIAVKKMTPYLGKFDSLTVKLLIKALESKTRNYIKKIDKNIFNSYTFVSELILIFSKNSIKGEIKMTTNDEIGDLIKKLEDGCFQKSILSGAENLIKDSKFPDDSSLLDFLKKINALKGLEILIQVPVSEEFFSVTRGIRICWDPLTGVPYIKS